MVTRVGGTEVQSFLKKWVADQFKTSQEKVIMNALLRDYGCEENDLGPLSVAILHRFGLWIDFDDSSCIQPLECLYLNDILDKVEAFIGKTGDKQHQRT